MNNNLDTGKIGDFYYQRVLANITSWCDTDGRVLNDASIDKISNNISGDSNTDNTDYRNLCNFSYQELYSCSCERSSAKANTVTNSHVQEKGYQFVKKMPGAAGAFYGAEENDNLVDVTKTW